VCGDQRDNDCDSKIDEDPDPAGKDTCGDGKDNDCDGETDEGHDQDMDGNQWCGDTTTPGGSAMGDCNDDDDTVYYGAPEICDALDNDCDGKTDESGPDKALCAAGEECIGRCVAPSCAVQGSITCRVGEMCDSKTGKCVTSACGPTSCAANEFCDAVTGVCTASKKPNGTACSDHPECVSGSCVESASLGLNIAEPRVCGQACCNDAECGVDQRCFAPGTGARSCMPIALVPRGPNTGISCTSNMQCLPDESCGLVHTLTVEGSIIDTDTAVSAPVCIDSVTVSPLALGDVCGRDQAKRCGAQVCVVQSFSQFGGAEFVCTSTCGSSADCVGLETTVATGQRSYCAIMEAPQGYVPFCLLDLSADETGTGDTGAACVRSGDCLDAACVRGPTGTGVCAATCCSDAQCPPVAGQPTHCRPVGVGEHFENRCVL
jgi:hypothetical protein